MFCWRQKKNERECYEYVIDTCISVWVKDVCGYEQSSHRGILSHHAWNYADMIQACMRGCEPAETQAQKRARTHTHTCTWPPMRAIRSNAYTNTRYTLTCIATYTQHAHVHGLRRMPVMMRECCSLSDAGNISTHIIATLPRTISWDAAAVSMHSQCSFFYVFSCADM